jgi:hypothetical protein
MVINMPQYGDVENTYIMAYTKQPKQAENEEIQTDIRDGYAFISGLHVPFSEREIIANKLYMTIPDHFSLMTEELAILKYPNKNRPHMIFADEEGEVSVSFTLTSDKLNNNDIEDAVDFLVQVIQKMTPKSVISRDFFIKGKTRIGCFDYISTAIDSEIYNLIFIFPLEGQFILGAFNCLHLVKARWQDVADQMVRSIRVV